MGAEEEYIPMSPADSWDYGIDGGEIVAGDKYDTTEDCSAIGFFARMFFHPGCWFTSVTYMAHMATCGTKGLCALAGEVRGAEMQAGIVLGCVLLSHLILLVVCLVRINRLTKARLAGYAPTEDKGLYLSDGKGELLSAVYASIVVAWAVILLIVNRGRGQLVGSVVAMCSIASLIVMSLMAVKHLKEKPARLQKEKQSPPVSGRSPGASDQKKLMKQPDFDYGTDDTTSKA